MKYPDLIKQINEFNIAPVYLLHGEEDFLKSEAVDALTNSLVKNFSRNIDIEMLSEEHSLEGILEIANTVGLFAQNKLLIAKNTEVFQTKKSPNKQKSSHGKEDELLKAYLENPSPHSKILFVLKGKADGRKKIFQLLDKKGLTVEFGQLRGRELLEWVKSRFAKHHKTVDYAVLDYLVASVGNDLASLENEVEKIALYLGESTKQVTIEIVQHMVSKTTQTTIFNLVDAFAEGKGAKAVDFARDLIKSGESEVLIVYMLARQFRLILEAKLLLDKGYTQGQLSQALQTQAFAVSKALKQGNKFSVEQLVATLEKLLELDVAIKTGQGNPALLLEMVIADSCR